MLSLHQVVDSLYTQARPVLTWYGPDRVELGGPVLARWFSKTANLLTHEYTDLYAPSPGASQHMVVDLPSCWQKIIWVSAATLCGWTVTIPPRQEGFTAHESPGDALVHDDSPTAEPTSLPPVTVYVTNHLSAAAERAQEEGADLFLHNLAFLALQWEEELPAAAIDALEALMSHNDILEHEHEAQDWPPRTMRSSAGDTAAPVLSSSHTLSDTERCVFHEGDALTLCAPLTALWAQAGSAIVIDPAYYDNVDEIMLTERPHNA
ncbi:TIGR03089 family protein [Schaalia sp. Marseille-Q2122]|uniref:TIGR03089 family protein n=1 Tax=Schaalia sp. Marseille-Q2122 TaxID=2736604 RepID=UPI0026DB7E09|nr:TIGR03089 family protein [Schaalia sp. Marseille-Q2122]